jgi:hypothetical protein
MLNGRRGVAVLFVAKPLGKHRAKVTPAARAKIYDDAHRPARIRLRPCDLQHKPQRGSARGQMQKSTARKFDSALLSADVSHARIPRYAA